MGRTTSTSRIQSIVHVRYVAAYAAQNRQLPFQLKMIIATFELIRSATTVPIYVWYFRIRRSPNDTIGTQRLLTKVIRLTDGSVDLWFCIPFGSENLVPICFGFLPNQLATTMYQLRTD